MNLLKTFSALTCIVLVAFLSAVTTQPCPAQSPASAARDATSKQTYLYASNLGDQSISQFQITADGTLVPLPTGRVHFGRGSLPFITFAPSGRYAYIPNEMDNTIAEFAVNTNGTLSPLDPSTVGTGKGPQSLTIDPTGRSVYVGNVGDDTISEFRVSSSGTLVPVAKASFGRGKRPSSVQFSPNGQSAYVINMGGPLTKQKVIKRNAAEPGAAAFQENVVSSSDVEVIRNMSISPVPDAGPRSLTFADGGQSAYLIVWGGGTNQDYLYQYRVLNNGTLQPLTPARFAVGKPAGTPTLAPSGRFLYVPCDERVYQFRITEGGAIMPLSKPVLSTPPYSGGLVIDPTGQWAYQNNAENDTISQYRVSLNGLLQPLIPTTVATGSFPEIPIIDPTGKFLYVLNLKDNDVSQFQIGTDGELLPLSPANVPAGTSPIVLTIHQQ